MILKDLKFNHDEKGFNAAIGIDENMLLTCRERIYFTHFASGLKALELFDSKDCIPKQLTTLTGDLERCLEIIDNSLEYEITLLNFMSHHNLASKGFGYYKFYNDPSNSEQEKNDLKMFMKMLAADNDLDILDITHINNRVNSVKKSHYNFTKYMQLMGYVKRDFDEVDKILNELFK